VSDGSTILVGGFGGAGVPEELIDALIAQGAKDLTIVNNNAGNAEFGVAALLKAGRVRKIVCSYPRTADSLRVRCALSCRENRARPRAAGTLSERMRAAGAGIGAFYTPTGYGTDLAKGKETRMIDGRGHVLEYPIRGDVRSSKRSAATAGATSSTARARATSTDHGERGESAPSPRSTRPSNWRARSGVHRDAGDFRHARREGAAEEASGAGSGAGGMSYAKLTRDENGTRIANDIPEAHTSISGSDCDAGREPPAEGREIFLHTRTASWEWGRRPRRGWRTWTDQSGKEPAPCSPAARISTNRFVRDDARRASGICVLERSSVRDR